MKLYKFIKNNQYICYNIEVEKSSTINYLKLYDLLETDVYILNTKNLDIVEIGPKNKNNNWSNNTLLICKSANLNFIKSIFKSHIYLVSKNFNIDKFFNDNHNSITEMIYEKNNNPTQSNQVNKKSSNINSILFKKADKFSYSTDSNNNFFINGNIYYNDNLQPSINHLINESKKTFLDDVNDTYGT